MSAARNATPSFEQLRADVDERIQAAFQYFFIADLAALDVEFFRCLDDEFCNDGIGNALATAFRVFVVAGVGLLAEASHRTQLVDDTRGQRYVFGFHFAAICRDAPAEVECRRDRSCGTDPC